MIVPFIAVTRYFIQSKYRPGSLHKNCHVINHSLVRKFHDHGFKDFFIRVHKDFEKSFPSYKKRSTFFIMLWTKYLPQISNALRVNSVGIVRNCKEQIEFVVAHRIRRSQQMVALYSRLWNERALKFVAQRLKRLLQRRSKHFIIGASLLSFDWNKEKIPDDELKRHVNEMDVCKILRDKALRGENTGQLEGEHNAECTCTDCKTDSNVHKWEPFIIEEDVTVWKMHDPNYKATGLFCYKLYGKYNEVTAEDFLQVFLDIENRIKWDTHAADLKLIDEDPDSQSDVIYWETKWPTLFSNRDYVFKRRYYRDVENNVIIVVNKSTEHPDFPPTNSKARVTEYWSYMVIKSTSHNLEEPGMEFSLTYFDNPGIALPTAISLWVTVQGMPEYLKRLRIEALKIGDRRRQEAAEKKEREESEKIKSESPPEPPLERPISDHESHLSPYDYVFIFSSYFHKIRASLWL